MKLCVVGTGYVGLVSATCFADAGHDVTGVDTDAAKVQALGSGKVPIYEPELLELLERARESGRIRFTTSYSEGCSGAEVVFICVGTPTGADGSADVSAVTGSARAAVEALTGPALVVIKSTVPVGTNDRLAEELAGASEFDVDFASNPEFLKEGAAVEDFLKPDRVVIGVRTRRASGVLHELYDPFVRTGAPIIETDPSSAEMSKYAANGMLACRISFMNEIARLCGALGADVESVRRIVGADRRVGGKFLFPGAGYGGSCFPKDVKALGAMGAETGVQVPIMRAVDETNRLQRGYLFELAKAHFGDLGGLRFAVWGLAFKPRTDDVRESPAIDLVRALVEAGAEVAAYDPEAEANARAALGDVASRVRFARERYDAAAGADALALVTEWPEFRRPDPARLAEAMKGTVIFDGRNVLDARALARAGFTVHSVGRPTVKPEG
ncbi:MAG: UDP-glucose dehydrogenase family protein [Planctomycetota bacterium]|jgi:UDPglucose 6-dehydrogenase